MEPQEERKGGCPCEHTTPCHPDCTCINHFMSRGCERCCRYGSSEQQKAMAEYLVAEESLAYIRGLEAALEAAESQCLDKETALANGEYRTGQYRGADDCCIMIQRLIDEAVKK